MTADLPTSLDELRRRPDQPNGFGLTYDPSVDDRYADDIRRTMRHLWEGYDPYEMAIWIKLTPEEKDHVICLARML